LSIIAVTGLAKEARIARRAGLLTVVGACNPELLSARLEKFVDKTEAVVSFGIAGSLSPLLRAGDVVVGSHVVVENEHYVCDPEWSRRIHERLPGSRMVIVAGVDYVVSHIAMKRALTSTAGAHAVDMESHMAARFAWMLDVPLVVIRTISDGHSRTLPPAALEPLKPNGKPKLAAVLKSLCADPTQLGELLVTAYESRKAFCALARCRRMLGRGLGCPYLA
jgi:adenosylhomocysteine nucleosidase